jgi:hypothetical protein
MYRKDKIRYISDSVVFLRYIVSPDADVHVYLYDNVNKRDLYQLSRTYTLSISLFVDQFSLDEDKSMIYLSPDIIGQHIRVEYYTEGMENPFFYGSSLNRFVSNMLRWMDTRIIDGLYVYWRDYEEGYPIKRIRSGSFVYDGTFYTFPGGNFDIRRNAPPSIKGRFRSYLLFINDEILKSYVFYQNMMLNKVGVIHSSSVNSDMSITKEDVDSVYSSRYYSSPLKIAYIHVYLTDTMDYEIWIEYPSESRSM